jgi:hypothetical protein
MITANSKQALWIVLTPRQSVNDPVTCINRKSPDEVMAPLLDAYSDATGNSDLQTVIENDAAVQDKIQNQLVRKGIPRYIYIHDDESVTSYQIFHRLPHSYDDH